MGSQPVRVASEVYEEVQQTAQLLGCSSGELLAKAWDVYRQSPEFQKDFTDFQQLVRSGDFAAVTQRLRERRLELAKTQATAAAAARGVRATSDKR